MPTGTPLKTLAQRRPLAAAERDARLRTVAQRLERQGITSSLNNTVRSSDIKQMFFAVDEVFITVHKSNCHSALDPTHCVIAHRSSSAARSANI